MEVLEGAAQIAGVRGQHHVAAAESHLQGLVSGGVAKGGKAHDAAVAEEIVLSVDHQPLVAQIVVTRIEVVRGDLVRVAARLPFASLHHQCGIGNLRVAPAVIEMKMGIH